MKKAISKPRTRDPVDRQAAFQRGVDAEDVAARWLEALGFVEIDRRARMKGGELDLIMEDAETLIFVEVKARAKLSAGAESLSARQQARIRTGLRAWLAIHDPSGERAATRSIRCDVVLVAPGVDPVHIPNAFPAAQDDGF